MVINAVTILIAVMTIIIKIAIIKFFIIIHLMMVFLTATIITPRTYKCYFASFPPYLK